MISFLLLPALAIGAAAQGLSIATPTEGGTTPGAAECQPLLLTWTGGPRTLSVDTDPIGTTHIAEFDAQTGTSVSWTAVNASVGTQLLLSIKDSTGAPATSAPFPVTAGSGDGCLTAGGSSGGGSTGSSAGSGGTPPSSAPGNSATGGSGTSNTQSAASGASTSTKPASSSSSSAKSSNTTGAGMAVQAPAGLVPAFAAVVLAGLVALLA
ncbi:hypothetical protein B0H12DRAFT_395700 [Mycena haematopus]|nr:hypothetical protein B0H12DRAFT_395700 [Mycena haematopus]